MQLMLRSNRRVSLTPAGAAFLAEAKTLLRMADDAVQRTRRVNSGELGELKIGCTALALYTVIPSMITTFQQQMPNIGIKLLQMDTAIQETALRKGEIQVGILHPPIDDPIFTTAEVIQLPFEVVLRSDHPLAEKRTISMASLSGEPFVMWPRDATPRIFDLFVDYCEKAGFTPNIVQQLSPATSIIGMVASGIGVSLLIQPYQQLAIDNVVFRKLRGTPLNLTISAAYRSDDTSAIVTKFIEIAHRSRNPTANNL